MLQLVLVLGRHDGHVGQVPQIGQVKGAMMGRAVIAHDSGPVQGKGHPQILQTDIVKDLIIGALQKR